jgi:hypothetical protein
MAQHDEKGYGNSSRDIRALSLYRFLAIEISPRPHPSLPPPKNTIRYYSVSMSMYVCMEKIQQIEPPSPSKKINSILCKARKDKSKAVCRLNTFSGRQEA